MYRSLHTHSIHSKIPQRCCRQPPSSPSSHQARQRSTSPAKHAPRHSTPRFPSSTALQYPFQPFLQRHPSHCQLFTNTTTKVSEHPLILYPNMMLPIAQHHQTTLTHHTQRFNSNTTDVQNQQRFNSNTTDVQNQLKHTATVPWKHPDITEPYWTHTPTTTKPTIPPNKRTKHGKTKYTKSRVPAVKYSSTCVGHRIGRQIATAVCVVIFMVHPLCPCVGIATMPLTSIKNPLIKTPPCTIAKENQWKTGMHAMPVVPG